MNTGGSAFPSHGSMGEVTHEGMTLRDYFAAKAMQTYMINEVWNPDTYKGAAITAYRVADAMLKAREA
jgi:hypothetical protein